MLSVTHSKDTGIVFNWRQVATKEGNDTEMFRERGNRVSKGIQGNKKNSGNTISYLLAIFFFNKNTLSRIIF